MKKILLLLSLAIASLSFSGCEKWSVEHRDISSYVAPPASPISDSAPLCGSIKGTMISGKTYTIGCDVTVGSKDTLIIQPGVKVYMAAPVAIVVQGTFVSNGTKDSPIFLTVKDLAKNDAPGIPVASDPAFSAKWKGVLAATSCPLLVLRWTHIEFAGAAYGPTVGPLLGQTNSTSFAVLFQNPTGSFVMEDSWLYGATDDAMRISNGKVHIMRNTFEKAGLSGGDCINVKGGTVGTMAYNFFIGTATNGQKVSNKGQAAGSPQTNIVMYNNTFVNGGYRQTQTGRGANINYEEGARGMFYNNVNINCKFGYRVVGNPAADIPNLTYGYNYQYADSLSVANQFYPVGYVTKPQQSDLPSISFLPANYSVGAPYNGAAAVQQLNPQFINYPLPMPAGTKLSDIKSIGTYNFHLKPNSPLIGKSFLTFQALTVVPVDPEKGFGAKEVTPPGIDLGCYQSNGTGNQH